MMLLKINSISSSTEDSAIWSGDTNSSRKEEVSPNKLEKGKSLLLADIKPEKEKYKFVKSYQFSTKNYYTRSDNDEWK